MNRYFAPLNNDHGFILVLGMSLLVVLTLIGLSAIRSSVTDLRIASNERNITENFYVTDSTWQVGSLWLNNRSSYADFVNTPFATVCGTDQVCIARRDAVRNFGNGGANGYNESLAAADRDGSFLGTDFWYRVIYKGDAAAVGYSKETREFFSEIHNRTSQIAGINVRLSRRFKVGY